MPIANPGSKRSPASWQRAGRGARAWCWRARRCADATATFCVTARDAAEPHLMISISSFSTLRRRSSSAGSISGGIISCRHRCSTANLPRWSGLERTRAPFRRMPGNRRRRSSSRSCTSCGGSRRSGVGRDDRRRLAGRLRDVFPFSAMRGYWTTAWRRSLDAGTIAISIALAIGLISVRATIAADLFSLVDADGRTVTSADFTGKWLLIYFGYTNCADQCPTALSTMTEALDEIGAAADHVQPLFITIDPERDGGPSLRGFTAAFDRRLIGLSGTPE